MLIESKFEHNLPLGQWKLLHKQFCHSNPRVTVRIGKRYVNVFADNFPACESMTNLILTALAEYTR